jgi:hypothetical protein
VNEETFRCRNCGTPAPGDYCPSCGQETRTRAPTFIAFMREAGGRYVALDGRLWKTLSALLFRPGFLTREYFAGRRRRYIRPARLFLVTSLVMFAALRIAVELRQQDILRLDASGKPATAAKEGRNEGQNALDDAFDVNIGGMEFPTIRKRLEHFNQLSSEQKEAQITDGIFRYGPYAMFVLLPAFALMLKLLYLGRGRRYPSRPRLYADHIVFAAHNHAFLFLAIVAASLLVGVLRGAVIVWMLVYMVWSLHVVYGGSWLGIAVRSIAMLLFYTIMFGLVTAGLVVAAVLLR